MTDELSPGFLEFSEMLDQVDLQCDADLGENGELLLELRRELRGQGSLPTLPRGFAAETAALAKTRYDSLPLMTRWLGALPPALVGTPLAARAVPWLFAGTIGGLLSLSYSWQALELLAGLTVLVCAPLAWLYRRRYPAALDLPELERGLPGSGGTSRLFFLIPTLAVLMTGGLLGAAVGKLSEVSLSFQSQGPNLKLIGVATVVVVAVALYNACWPLWRAYEEVGRGRWLRSFEVQAFHWLWLAAVLTLWNMMQHGMMSWAGPDLAERVVIVCQGGAALVATAAARKRQESQPRYWLWPALKRSFKGFLVGFLPLLAVLVVTYQAGLTREFDQPAAYQALTRDVGTWLRQRQSIAPERNGATELTPFFERNPDKRATAIANRLKKGSELEPDLYPLPDRQAIEHAKDRAKAKKSFLQELPRIEAALRAPELSFVPAGEFSMATLVPNFITMRAISQGLQGLVRDELQAGQTAPAVHHLLVGLRWSTVVRDDGTMINLMIGIAQNSIALREVERVLFQGQPTAAQLRDLLATLTATMPRQEGFAAAMKREAYAADQTFQTLAGGGRKSYLDMGWSDRQMALVPRSYWESERRVFLNLELSQMAGWYDLGAPNDVDLQAMLPWSLAAQTIIANTRRAQLQFMKTRSRFDALRIATALELYKAERGSYPEKLQALVPSYLDGLPVDAMHPNLWKKKEGFSYHRKGAHYELLSTSPLYHTISLATVQSYGPDGDYNEAQASADN